MAYRNDLAALAARKQALDIEIANRTRERDEAAAMLADAEARAKELVFDKLRIASPCGMAWAAMEGDDRVRTCRQCDKQVFDLSALTRAEAAALIAETNGQLCATYYQRSDGTILLSDCEIGRRRMRRLRVIAAGVVLATAGGVMAVATRLTSVRVMGGMASVERAPHTGATMALANECVSLRNRIFELDDCVGPEVRARLRKLFVEVAQPFEPPFSLRLGDPLVEGPLEPPRAEACHAATGSLATLADACKRWR